MSIDDVDRDLRMQERLNTLIRVWQIDNGETSFEIVRGGDGWPAAHSWGIELSASNNYDHFGEAASWSDVRTHRWTGETIAHAVELAWERHGSPTLCQACEGEGEFRHYYVAGEIHGPLTLGETLATHHDGSATTVSKLCAACGGEGMFVQPHEEIDW